MKNGEITVERLGFLSWEVWVSSDLGYDDGGNRFTKRGAVEYGRRLLKREIRRRESQETL